jgi:hypothetical protein
MPEDGGGRSTLGGRTKSRSRVAAAEGDKAALPPQYMCLLQLQQRLVGNDLDSYCDWRLDDGDEGGASTGGCEAGEVGRRKALLRAACHECWALTAIILGASSSASNVSGK